MAAVGKNRSVVDTRNIGEDQLPSIDKEEAKHYNPKGILGFLIWRGAYWTKAVSITNKFLIPMYWFKSFFFGRDISRF